MRVHQVLGGHSLSLCLGPELLISGQATKKGFLNKKKLSFNLMLVYMNNPQKLKISAMYENDLFPNNPSSIHRSVWKQN